MRLLPLSRNCHSIVASKFHSEKFATKQSKTFGCPACLRGLSVSAAYRFSHSTFSQPAQPRGSTLGIVTRRNGDATPLVT